jgi:hypothetical protein
MKKILLAIKTFFLSLKVKKEKSFNSYSDDDELQEVYEEAFDMARKGGSSFNPFPIFKHILLSDSASAVNDLHYAWKDGYEDGLKSD